MNFINAVSLINTKVAGGYWWHGIAAAACQQRMRIGECSIARLRRGIATIIYIFTSG
jgi:hypothetical protein